ncbi:hypothetical protein B0H66DRAFT_54586 [Apodospora peruviana]|uniref:Ribosomal protein L9 domain-containing protein n=1 Tax=Apodospora peruviana TaxID=516989 RepID=A0AAE0ISD7_9PEZI|nr:hypothetical protein B0H66DRAFT_54586 [Apodospora peruviana]
MAQSALSRWPTCLACLRRLAQPSSSSVLNSTGVVMQTRAKSNHPRPMDQGVVVRLLMDIPKFGRKHAVFRTERGRMRNIWFPTNKAEYMTPTRFQELGLTHEDVGVRDRAFGVYSAEDADAPVAEEPEDVTAAATKKPSHTSPEVAFSLLATLVPETLTFHRKPIPAAAAEAPPPPAPTTPAQPAVSPLIAVANTPTPKRKTAEPEAASTQDTTLGIYGSVSTFDITNYVRGYLISDAEASRIALDPTSIRIVGLGENNTRLKSLGRWEVEISVGAEKPVRKMVEVLPATGS